MSGFWCNLFEKTRVWTSLSVVKRERKCNLSLRNRIFPFKGHGE